MVHFISGFSFNKILGIQYRAYEKTFPICSVLEKKGYNKWGNKYFLFNLRTQYFMCFLTLEYLFLSANIDL